MCEILTVTNQLLQFTPNHFLYLLLISLESMSSLKRFFEWTGAIQIEQDTTFKVFNTNPHFSNPILPNTHIYHLFQVLLFPHNITGFQGRQECYVTYRWLSHPRDNNVTDKFSLNLEHRNIFPLKFISEKFLITFNNWEIRVIYTFIRSNI